MLTAHDRNEIALFTEFLTFIAAGLSNFEAEVAAYTLEMFR